MIAQAAPAFGVDYYDMDEEQGDGNDVLRKRGKYRCRKCGEEKRAHDCPFACKQRSVSTQTNLEVTGGISNMTMDFTMTVNRLYPYYHHQDSQRRRPAEFC